MVYKFARLECKQLKSTVCDFYTVEDISLAKEKLSSAIDELQIYKFPKMVMRRKDSINRSTTKVYDIFLALNFLDEARVLHNLPTFVSDDPDNMPSVKLTDGDMAAVMLELSILEEAVSAVKHVDDQNVVNSLQINRTNNQPTIIRRQKPVASASSATVPAPQTSSNNNTIRHLPSSDYPMLPSRPILTSVSDMVNSDADEASDGVPWLQSTRSHKKRALQ